MRKKASHWVGAYRKGREAYRDGKGLGDCPYSDRRTRNGKVTFSRAFQGRWHEGWWDERGGVRDRYTSEA